MLDEFGKPIIGHGFIPEFELNTMRAQLQKRSDNPKEYHKKIFEELLAEQGPYYRIIQDFSEEFAEKLYERDSDEFEHIVNCFMMIAAMTYKFASLRLEQRFMEDEIAL